MSKDNWTPYVPKFDTSKWRVGFEVEMLFGDLGLKRYRKVSEEDGGFDVASLRYCEDIAHRLTKLTGEKWMGTEEPKGEGFFVMPERDLDPYDFSVGTVGGVELITPPLPMAEAEELRLSIIAAVKDMKNGYCNHCDEHHAGWHVNVDKASRQGDIQPHYICAGLWEGADSEVEILLETQRYGNGVRYAAPQHHAYGPALLLALHSAPFPLESDDITGFLHHHCGRSKRFAANFGKLDRDYVELRHLGLSQFMEGGVSTAEYLDTVFKAMTIAPSNSGHYLDRLLDRFTLLGEWLHPLQTRFAIQTRDKQRRGREGRVLFDGDEVARISWNGVGELRFGSDADELRDLDDITLDDRVFPEHTTGLDADELLAGVAVLAMDSLHFDRCDVELPTLPRAFLEEVSALRERYEAEGMIGSDMTSEMVQKM